MDVDKVYGSGVDARERRSTRKGAETGRGGRRALPAGVARPMMLPTLLVRVADALLVQ